MMAFIAGLLYGLVAGGIIGLGIAVWVSEAQRIRRQRAIDRALDSVRRDLETDGEELLRHDARRRREIGL